MKLRKIAVIAFVVLLMVSLCMNAYLYQKVFNQYQSLQAVRLDPMGIRNYSASNTRLQAPQPGISRIVFFGDSRIARWNPLPDLENGQVLNRGVPSETTAQAVLRLKDDVLELKPDIVVVQIGINDLKNIGVFPDRKEEIIGSCWENFNLMVEQMTDQDIQLVILTIFPPGSVGWLRRSLWSDDIRSGVDQVNKRIKSLEDRGITVVNCDHILRLDRKINPKFALDTLHLNSAGYEALNSSLDPVLRELIQDSLEAKN